MPATAKPRRRHPLLGRYMNWSDDDGEHYSTFKLKADLGDGFFLIERIGMQSRQPLNQHLVVALGQLACAREGAVIYGTTLDSIESWSDDDEKPRVVSLVKDKP